MFRSSIAANLAATIGATAALGSAPHPMRGGPRRSCRDLGAPRAPNAAGERVVGGSHAQTKTKTDMWEIIIEMHGNPLHAISFLQVDWVCKVWHKNIFFFQKTFAPYYDTS